MGFGQPSDRVALVRDDHKCALAYSGPLALAAPAPHEAAPVYQVTGQWLTLPQCLNYLSGVQQDRQVCAGGDPKRTMPRSPLYVLNPQVI